MTEPGAGDALCEVDEDGVSDHHDDGERGGGNSAEGKEANQRDCYQCDQAGGEMETESLGGRFRD